MAVRAKMLSSRCRSRASRYSGTRLAAKGRNRVEMKKKSTSCVRLTGLMASAYAAGSPRTRTKKVEPMLAIAELMKNGGECPDITSWNSSRVGTKKIVGGELAACGSVLKASNHIHRTGKKKTRTTNQPITVQMTFESGELPRGIGLALIALALIAWPPPGRWRTASGARRSQ